MSTERSTFGLDSFLPTGYRSKAEAFAKCLQDKLRTLGSGEEVPAPNGQREDSPKVFDRFTEEEIDNNVFIQGPLSYKRRSIPERCDKPQNGTSREKYFGSLVDKRGMSSDSEDSEEDNAGTAVNRRVLQLQNEETTKLNRMASINSTDSTTSWCSCEEGPDPDEDEEVSVLALQVKGKGSPPVQSSRLRNFRRKGKEDKLRREKSIPPTQDADLFFDFDVECFSPVNVEDEAELFEDFEKARLRLVDDKSREEVDGQNRNFLRQPNIVTPPPSPANGKIESSFEKGVLYDESIAVDEKQGVITELELNQQGGNAPNSIFESEPVESLETLQATNAESDATDPEYNRFYKAAYHKDSGICSCDETSSRFGDDEPGETPGDGGKEVEEPLPEVCQENGEEGNERWGNDSGQAEESSPKEGEKTEEYPECNPEDYIEKKEVNSSVMVLCDGVLIDENYLPSPRMKLRRCSSLKTWKTPPGTPGRKKIVRFADALGLDLADVRTFLDEIPKIPNSAFEDLHYELPPVQPPPTTERTLIPMFQQPGTQIDFLQKVRNNNVSLESAILTDVSLLAISGIVRVRNLSFHKTVHVRYSKDMWATFADLQATYVPSTSDGFCDNFSFTLYGHTLNVGEKLEFAIRYECAAGQFWDSNMGQNYIFQCMPRNNMPLFPPLGSSPVDNPWTKFY